MVNPTSARSSLKSPQEVEVHFILPALRRELSRELKEMGYEQKAIATLLHVSAPAVSQYMTEKRGGDVEFNTAVKMLIKETAQKLVKQDGELIHETQFLIRAVRNERITCQVCHETVPGVPPGCDACFR